MCWADTVGYAQLPGEDRPYLHIMPHPGYPDPLCVQRFATCAELRAWLDRPAVIRPAHLPAWWHDSPPLVAPSYRIGSTP
jgi:hypothetical protein